MAECKADMKGRNPYLPAAALALCLAAPALLVGTAAGAAAIDHDREFQACVELAERAPADALDSARGWQNRGGGDRARLCQALALFHKGDFKEAGTRLEELAPLLGRESPQAEASILARAGWAWLRAGDEARAERLYGIALAKQPEDVDLHIDRAIARAEAERYWDAIADLDAALAKAPRRADAYFYRAAAHKALSNLRQALADADQSLHLRPDNPETLLLRGNIHALSGGLNAARRDWERILRTAPESAPAKAARSNLERLPPADAEPAPKPERDKPKKP